ncbi:hypothetical protein AYI70_g795 [Smittium culicis]|uniref:Uncharacterized protein n=2 Tax=Smittium culicis TaxID=133412 RepID=A0A1R1YFB2_9FUNG|nr:hypothetical protein AYI70_g795 [Smittium culicis]
MVNKLKAEAVELIDAASFKIDSNQIFDLPADSSTQGNDKTTESVAEQQKWDRLHSIESDLKLDIENEPNYQTSYLKSDFHLEKIKAKLTTFSFWLKKLEALCEKHGLSALQLPELLEFQNPYTIPPSSSINLAEYDGFADSIEIQRLETDNDFSKDLFQPTHYQQLNISRNSDINLTCPAPSFFNPSSHFPSVGQNISNAENNPLPINSLAATRQSNWLLDALTFERSIISSITKTTDQTPSTDNLHIDQISSLPDFSHDKISLLSNEISNRNKKLSMNIQATLSAPPLPHFLL